MLYFNNCYSCFNPILFNLKNKNNFFYYFCLLGNIQEERTGHGSDHIVGSDFTSMFLKKWIEKIMGYSFKISFLKSHRTLVSLTSFLFKQESKDVVVWVGRSKEKHPKEKEVLNKNQEQRH